MKARKEPWICEGTRTGGGSCAWRAMFHCPACGRIFCDTCFISHQGSCKVYTGTDQCLCIWPINNEYPACGHDMRGAKGAEGHQGFREEGN